MRVRPRDRSLVSVIVPLYNKARTVERAIRSAIDVAYRPLEVVIADDGSSDGSFEKALEIAAGNPELVRVVWAEDRRNRGPGAARNLALAHSRGDYVCFLDADDSILPDRLDVATEILDGDPSTDAVFESVTVEFESEASRSEWGDHAIRWTVRSGDGDPAVAILESRSFWNTNAILCRRSLFARLGGFSERLRVGEDREMWFRMALCASLRPGNQTSAVAVVRRGEGHTWSPARARDTVRDVANSARVALWAMWNRRLVRPGRLKAFRSSFAAEIVCAMRVLREERCYGDGVLVATAAVLAPSVFLCRLYWGNLAYSLRDALLGRSR